MNHTASSIYQCDINMFAKYSLAFFRRGREIPQIKPTFTQMRIIPSNLKVDLSTGSTVIIPMKGCQNQSLRYKYQ